MYSRVLESDKEIVVKHYRVFFASAALLLNWLFVYVTFSSERGGLLTLLLATLCLLLAAGLAEVRTTRFDRQAQTMEVATLGTLGQSVLYVPFAEVLGLSQERMGTPALAVDSVSVDTLHNGSIEIAGYVVFQNNDAELGPYLLTWLANSGWRPSES